MTRDEERKWEADLDYEMWRRGREPVHPDNLARLHESFDYPEEAADYECRRLDNKRREEQEMYEEDEE